MNAAPIVTLGDSLTWGYPGTWRADSGQAMRQSTCAWPRLLADALGRTVYNAGINGDTLGGMLERIRTDVLVHRPGLVIVSGGSNDAGQGFYLVEMQRSARRIRAVLEQHNTPCIFALPLPFHPERTAEHFNITDINALHRATEVLDAFREWLRAWAAPALDFAAPFYTGGALRSELLPDGIHPDCAGYTLMAQVAITALRLHSS